MPRKPAPPLPPVHPRSAPILRGRTDCIEREPGTSLDRRRACGVGSRHCGQIGSVLYVVGLRNLLSRVDAPRSEDSAHFLPHAHATRERWVRRLPLRDYYHHAQVVGSRSPKARGLERSLEWRRRRATLRAESSWIARQERTTSESLVRYEVDSCCTSGRRAA